MCLTEVRLNPAIERMVPQEEQVLQHPPGRFFSAPPMPSKKDFHKTQHNALFPYRNSATRI